MLASKLFFHHTTSIWKTIQYTYERSFLRTCLDCRSSISKILHHISFLLVNLGFTMSIKLYLKNCDKTLDRGLGVFTEWVFIFKKIVIFALLMCQEYCWFEFLFFHTKIIYVKDALTVQIGHIRCTVAQKKHIGPHFYFWFDV